MTLDIAEHSRRSWNKQVREGCRWTIPVSKELIAFARDGQWTLFLTPNRPVPRAWFPSLDEAHVLCLASGGGQQAPILAAAGAIVTSFDNSDEQLAQDRRVADRDGLELFTERGDMRDLSRFADGSFDLIFHPVSNVFIPDVHPVWRECARVLKPGGSLLAGFMNPTFFLFNHDEALAGEPLRVKHPLPYSDLDLAAEKREKLLNDEVAFEFSHSLEDQITGQLRAGLMLGDLFEDDWSDEATPLNKYCATSIATKSTKRP
ncbi:MAG: class I SAM-dependent methyltransferase [Planctomycetota bacterium]|nr:class I SAM-dependent methyltransferase [Planctomycetota bacterium]